jgi:hypothetical protein
MGSDCSSRLEIRTAAATCVRLSMNDKGLGISLKTLFTVELCVLKRSKNATFCEPL